MSSIPQIPGIEFPVLNGVPLMLMTGEELAAAIKFGGVTSGFRSWCAKLGIKTVPGRSNIYDPKHVRERLDAAQGMNAPAAPASLVAQRRARRGQA
ncbi:hypothetical protein [Acidimangrovimonas sediminis]|uniref:hypothetical protein n=1 Tax=Acidimangrovimonas sediminis TaxID=2056283 RepID=UPI0011AF071C|nr:hypothetical protein [Acidimangrovimonas sediminis]